jgi:hypothetical protein
VKLPHNIEQNPRIRGEYLGYDAEGYAWLIVKSTSSFGNWCAISKHHPNRYLFAFRLSDMGKKLQNFNQAEAA